MIYKNADVVAVKRVADEIRRGQDPGSNENYDWLLSEALVVDQANPKSNDDNKLVACVAEQKVSTSKAVDDQVENKSDRIIDKLDKIIDVFAVQNPAQGGWNAHQGGWPGQRGSPRYHPYQQSYRGNRGAYRGHRGGFSRNYDSRSSRDGDGASTSGSANERRQRSAPACYTCGEDHAAINCPLKQYLIKAKELKDKEVGN